jgi:hypothetical protein
MGWNTSALFVQGLDPNAAAALLGCGAFVPTGHWVTADVATGGSQGGVLFAAAAEGWTEVWDPSMRLAPVCEPPGSALSVVFSSVASTYAFTRFQVGAEVRRWVYSEGELVVDEGTPVPVEAGMVLPSWGPDEDFLWTVIEAVTGRGYDPDAQFQIYRSR